MNKQDQPPTIKQTVRAIFALSDDAATLRESINKQLPNLTGRDHGVAHRAYTILNDLARGLDALDAQIAESRLLNRYLNT